VRLPLYNVINEFKGAGSVKKYSEDAFFDHFGNKTVIIISKNYSKIKHLKQFIVKMTTKLIFSS